jgi:hypothetical protein
MATGASYAGLPILNLRNINPSGYVSFWKAIETRGNALKQDTTLVYYQSEIVNKLSKDFPNFLHTIFDVSRFKPYVSPAPITNKQFLEMLQTKSFDREKRKIILSPIPGAFEFINVDIIDLYENGEKKVHMVDTITGEGFEPGRIDSYLSPYGNARISACKHAMIISKQADGNYLFIDPFGVYNYVNYREHLINRQGGDCKIFSMIQRALPPEKTIIESRCMIQGQLPVCFFLEHSFFMLS